MNAIYNIMQRKIKSKNEKAFLILFYTGILILLLTIAFYMYLVNKYVFSLSFMQIIKLIAVPYIGSFIIMIMASIAMTYIESIKIKKKLS